MKLFNLFKKESSRTLDSKNSTTQKLDKKQLEKVIGGGDNETSIDSTCTDNVTKAKHDAAMAAIQNTR